jgi:probable phosphoglycerate mutase
MMRIFFARHGESEANLLQVMSNRDIQHHLTQAGRDQAIALAKALEGQGIGHVYSSPICRARETAEIVSNRLGAALTIADGLREFDCGILEGLGDEESWKQHQWVQEQWYFHVNPAARIEEGESFIDIETRFGRTLGEIVHRHGEVGSAVLMLTHGATMTAMLPHLLANLTREQLWERGLTYTTFIEAKVGHYGLRCVRWNGQPYTTELEWE